MHHVIVGAGPAGVLAAEALRKFDADASITVIGDEAEPPYSRMAIPYLLHGQIDESGTYLRKTDGHYEAHGIEIVRDRVTGIDTATRRLTLASGATRDYDRLLLATGSRPATPPIPGIDRDAVHSCWTLEDARRIAELATAGSRVVLIGAGFIGCIILEALAARGVELTVVEAEPRMVPRMMNDAAAGLVKAWCIDKGVDVRTSTRVGAVEDGDGSPLSVSLEPGESIPADLVVTCTGVVPNIDFLEGSGIETDVGVLVNEHLCSSDANVFAAGDVAQGRDFSTGEYSVQAIQPTAAEHARLAAANMVGRPVRHQGSVNMNVLDTLGLITTSFGLWQGSDGPDADSAELVNADRFEYLNLQFDGDILVGASSLGITDHVGVLRGLIQSRVRLGIWKERLCGDPTRIMEAYLASTQAIGHVPAAAR